MHRSTAPGESILSLGDFHMRGAGFCSGPHPPLNISRKLTLELVQQTGALQWEVAPGRKLRRSLRILTGHTGSIAAILSAPWSRACSTATA